MPAQIKQIVLSQQIPNANTTVYTSAAGVRTRIDKVTVSNPTASSATVTLFVVPSGGSAGNSTTSTSAQAVLAGQTWNSPNEPGQVLQPGDFLVAIASAATTLTLMVAGTQVT